MTTIPVILITVAGAAGHVDVGIRSDVSMAELAASLGDVLGINPPWPGGEHRAPPRPGDPRGRRVQLPPGASLAAAGVSDGDLIIFGRAEDKPAAPRPAALADGQAGAGGGRPEIAGSRFGFDGRPAAISEEGTPR